MNKIVIIYYLYILWDSCQAKPTKIHTQPDHIGCLWCVSTAAAATRQDVCQAESPCGKYRMTFTYWSDAGKRRSEEDTSSNEIEQFIECAADEKCAKDSVISYLRKHSKDCNNDGYIDCYDYVNIHLHSEDSCGTGLQGPVLNAYTECASGFGIADNSISGGTSESPPRITWVSPASSATRATPTATPFPPTRTAMRTKPTYTLLPLDEPNPYYTQRYTVKPTETENVPLNRYPVQPVESQYGQSKPTRTQPSSDITFHSDERGDSLRKSLTDAYRFIANNKNSNLDLSNIKHHKGGEINFKVPQSVESTYYFVHSNYHTSTETLNGKKNVYRKAVVTVIDGGEIETYTLESNLKN